MSEPFRVLLADPPWKFGDKLPGRKRGAIKHYACMSTDDLCAYRSKLPPMHDDAFLFMWRVSAMVEECYRVIRAWGFVPKSEIVWIKSQDGVTRNPPRRLGMGRYVRLEHEVCVIATRGRPLRYVQSRRERSAIFAPRGEHSEKPDALQDLIERLCPGPYVELFARRQRPGWECQGLALGNAA